MNTLIDALRAAKIVTPEQAAKVEAEKRKALNKKYSLEKDTGERCGVCEKS